MPDDGDLEARLRDALSRAAPLGLPTIGVRERIVDAVRGRRARRQRIAGSVAAACLVVAGLTVGIAALHPSAAPGRTSAEAALGPRPSTNGGAAPPAAPRAARANCGQISVSGSGLAGCYGIFGNSPVAYGPGAPQPGSSSGSGSQKKQTTPGSPGSAAAAEPGGYEVAVPLDRTVTVDLAGTAGEIWTAPAVVAGQGSDASRVAVTTTRVSGAGEGSSATFESQVAVTVVVEASALGTCGDQHTPCGMPTRYWSVVLEFRAG